MKSFKNSVIAALAVSAFTLSGAHAASWQDSLNSAASQLSGSNAQASGGMSVSSLTSLLNGSSQSLTASSMNNAAGILSYCAKQKLASVTSADNVKNQVLDKLGLSTPENKTGHQLSGWPAGAAQQQKRPAVGPEYARQ